MSDPIVYIKKLISEHINGTFSTREFCDAIEEFWNFGDWPDSFLSADKKAIEELFDVVVLYSEFENDTYPAYKSKTDIYNASLKFMSRVTEK